jgi:hypothetical protein
MCTRCPPAAISDLDTLHLFNKRYTDKPDIKPNDLLQTYCVALANGGSVMTVETVTQPECGVI